MQVLAKDGAYGVRVYGGSATFEDLRIENEGSSWSGLYAYDTELRATRLEITGFSHTQAMELYSFYENASMSFSDCYLHDNQAGVLYAQAVSGFALDLSYAGCTVEDNLIESYGNVQTQGQVALSIEGGTWQRNEGLLGGAVHIGSGGSLEASDVLFHDNSASSGGAIYAFASPVTLGKGTQLTENEADGGGAVYLYAGSSGWFEGVVFRGNTTKGVGGAVLASLDGAHLEIRDSQFCGNSANNVGDGLYLLDGSVYLGHTLLHGHSNTALWGSGLSSAELRHLSAVANGTALDPGIGTLKLYDSVFWDNDVDLGSFGDTLIAETNAFGSAPSELGAGQLEVDDPGFIDSFVSGNCDHLPYLEPDSPLAGEASDGTDIGAFPVEEQDSEPPDSPVDSPVDSPADSPADSRRDSAPLDSVAPQARTWVSGGCGSPGPASALLLLGLGAWLLQRGRNSSGPTRSSRK